MSLWLESDCFRTRLIPLSLSKPTAHGNWKRQAQHRSLYEARFSLKLMKSGQATQRARCDLERKNACGQGSTGWESLSGWNLWLRNLNCLEINEALWDDSVLFMSLACSISNTGRREHCPKLGRSDPTEKTRPGGVWGALSSWFVDRQVNWFYSSLWASSFKCHAVWTWFLSL